MALTHARFCGGLAAALVLASITAPGVSAQPAGTTAAADPDNFAPASRSVKPVSVYRTTGGVTAPGNLVTGGATRFSGAGSSVVLDFDKEVGGLISLRFAGASAPGRQVGLAFSETAAHVGVNSDASRQSPGSDGALFTAVDGPGAYTMPKERLRGGFRYLTLFLGSDGWVDVDDVTLQFTPDPDRPHPRDYPNYFHSEDDLLDKLWYAGAYTVQTNTIAPDTGRSKYVPDPGWRNSAVVSSGTSVLTDGSKRDRTVWPGDLGVALRTAYASLNDMKSSRNALDVLYGLQRADGMLPYAGPEIGDRASADTYNSDTYHLWTLIGTGLYYRYTGDAAWVRSVWPKYVQALNFSLGKVDGTGLLNVTAPADWGRVWGTGQKITANALLHGALLAAAEIADGLGVTTYADTWRERAAGVKAAANARLWNPGTGLYRDIPGSDLHPQDGNAMAIWFELTDSPAKSASIARTLTANWTDIGAVTPEYPELIGTFTGSMELVAHLMANDDVGALTLMRRQWGFMLNSPNGTKSTFWENYFYDGSEYYRSSYASYAHGWASGPTNALTFFVLGLNPTGATRYDFVPHLGDLSHAEGNITTPAGEVKGAWDYAPGRFTSTLTAAAGTEGRIGVPTYGSPSVEVTVNGAVVWSGGRFRPGGGVTGGSADGTHIHLTGAGGGTYTVVATGVVRPESFDAGVVPGLLPPGYALCAAEGQTCTSNGTQVLAFGAGAYAYRTVDGPAACDITAFGKDPAPNVFKHCYLAPAGGPPGAARCGSENEVCRVDGRRAIAFGLNGAFRFMTVNGATGCSVGSFGSDPLYGVVKSCYVLPDGPLGAWTGCVYEGSTCPNRGLQAFGARGSYWAATSDGTAQCGRRTFGVDPLLNVVKACYLWTGAPSGFPRECAAENGTCSFNGMQTVAFGRNGSYTYRTFTGPVPCTRSAFGGDPIVDVVKSCYLVG